MSSHLFSGVPRLAHNTSWRNKKKKKKRELGHLLPKADWAKPLVYACLLRWKKCMWSNAGCSNWYQKGDTHRYMVSYGDSAKDYTSQIFSHRLPFHLFNLHFFFKPCLLTPAFLLFSTLLCTSVTVAGWNITEHSAQEPADRLAHIKNTKRRHLVTVRYDIQYKCWKLSYVKGLSAAAESWEVLAHILLKWGTAHLRMNCQECFKLTKLVWGS